MRNLRSRWTLIDYLRETFEQKRKRNNDTILEKMEKMIDGPLSRLAQAVKNRMKIEVNKW